MNHHGRKHNFAITQPCRKDTVYRITPRGRDRFCLITQRTLGNFLNCLAFNGLALWAAPLTPVDWLRISPAVG